MFEYKTYIDTFVSLLQAAATTTANPSLNLSLTSAVTTTSIRADDPDLVNIRPDMLPAIFVRISNKDDDFAGIGNPGSTSARVKTKAAIVFDVIGYYGKDGALSSNAQVMIEIYNFARNIESVIKQNFSLGGLALWMRPSSTDFFGPFKINGSPTKVCYIKVEAEILYR